MVDIWSIFGRYLVNFVVVDIYYNPTGRSAHSVHPMSVVHKRAILTVVHNMTFQTTPNIFRKLRSPTKSGPLFTDPPTTHSSPFLTHQTHPTCNFSLEMLSSPDSPVSPESKDSPESPNSPESPESMGVLRNISVNKNIVV